MIELDIQKQLHAAEGEMQLRLDLRIEKGQLVTLYGPSGSGKTSTLRILSGLMKPEQGKITVDGKVWFDSDKKVDLKPQKRNIGYVFQDYALFPHMTVLQNLEFAQNSGKNSIIPQLVEIVGLGDLQHRKPDTLSGGQQQRVALARALVQQPEILLLDEPLSALDMGIRLKLQEYIRKVHQEFKLTTILISHDIGEIHRLSDHVFMLENGRVTKRGSPAELFVNQNISGKFKFTGEVLGIEKEDVVFIVTVLIGTNVVKVVAQEDEVKGLKAGDQVVVVSKAFNPILYRVEG